METSAAVLSAQKQEFNISTVNLDAELRPEEVLVKVVAVGLCHTSNAGLMFSNK
jgi:Zn-dependent alcohol dehydrogenase